MTDDSRLDEYINDYLKNKYAMSYLDHKYGVDNCRRWRTNPDVKQEIETRQRQASKNELLLIEQWNNLKISSMDVIVKAIKGELGADNQVAMAKWVLSGERSYIESRAKALGEKSAGQSNAAREPLKIIRDNGNKATEPSA